jgi:hypothetical protein
MGIEGAGTSWRIVARHAGRTICMGAPFRRRFSTRASVWRVPRLGGLVPLLALGAALLPALARADCAGPSAELLWTYPDATTATVAPNSVFWAVSHAGELSVEVDGVPLAPRGSSVVERQQFVSAGPLSEGEHEFYARAEEPVADAGARVSERRLRFTVSRRELDERSVNIESVTVYPLSWNGDALANPPSGEYDTQCSERAISLAWSCNDIIPFGLARVAYEEQGGPNALLPPIAYLAQGGVLLPAGCPQHWVGADTKVPASRFRVASVLSTGVSDDQVFDGEVVVRTLADVYPQRHAAPSHVCSLRGGAPGAPGVALSGCWFGALALIGWFARRSKR